MRGREGEAFSRDQGLVGGVRAGIVLSNREVANLKTGLDRNCKENIVAAVWAILAVVGVFSLLNLIEYRRLD